MNRSGERRSATQAQLRRPKLSDLDLLSWPVARCDARRAHELLPAPERPQPQSVSHADAVHRLHSTSESEHRARGEISRVRSEPDTQPLVQLSGGAVRVSVAFISNSLRASNYAKLNLTLTRKLHVFLTKSFWSRIRSQIKLVSRWRERARSLVVCPK